MNYRTSGCVSKDMDKHLLILDLDETLVYGREQSLVRDCDFQVGPYCVYKRPFLAQFIDSISKWFELAVWSSASSPYVAAVVAQLFRGRGALRFVWSQKRCTLRFHAEKLEHNWVKNLKKIKRLGFPLERVLVIDDSPEKLEAQYGNHLRLRPFMGQPDDSELRVVLAFLDYLRGVENLRTVDKRHWREFGKNQ